MKDIPIVILNKDRCDALKQVVASLHKRNYTNITVIDNRSTYQPLLDWYKESGIDVYYNDTPRTCNGSFYFLAYEQGVEKFRKIIESGYYCFNDSDVVPIDECPNDFVDDLIEIVKQFSLHKCGLGLKIDDLPDYFHEKQFTLEHEGKFWTQKIEGAKMPLYKACIDTTFAVYAPGRMPVWGGYDKVYQGQWWSGACLRTGGNYVAKHLPWYYDYNNLPVDEKYYILNLEAGKGPCLSFRAKEIVK